MYVLKNKLYLLAVALIDFCGYIIVSILRIFRVLKFPAEVNNILVIRLDHIGDVVYSTCVPQNLKAHYPQAKVDFLVAGWAKELVSGNPYIDRVICYDAPWFNRGSKKAAGFGDFLRLAGELRRKKYDLGFDLRGDLRHIILMWLAGVKFRVGYGITGGAFLLGRNARYRKDAYAGHNLDLLEAVGIRPVTSKPEIYTSGKNEDFVTNLFRQHSLYDSELIVGVHPYAGHSSRNWQDGRFAQLMRRLRDKYNAKIILVGGQGDRSSSQNIIAASGIEAVNLSGRAALGDLAALFKRINLFIGVDSGPSHIAASLGRPTVVLYSGINTRSEWGQKGGKIAVVQKDVPCKGCEKLKCAAHICMEAISVDDVMAAVSEVLKR